MWPKGIRKKKPYTASELSQRGCEKVHNPSVWEPVPTPADLANPVKSGLPGGYVELFSDANRYWAVLPADPATYRLVAEVKTGELSFTIKTPSRGQLGVGTGLFALMWAKIGHQVKSIYSSWVAGDPAVPDQALDTNLKQFNSAYRKYRAGGLSVVDSQKKAALDDTWTGKRSKGLGLTNVYISVLFGIEGAWDTVEVVFS